MGTKRRRNSKRQEEGASNNRRPRTQKDIFERAVVDVIERERRNLQRASAPPGTHLRRYFLTVMLNHHDEEWQLHEFSSYEVLKVELQ